MLKNLEKLNGFYIDPNTPIEMIYDANGIKFLSYFVFLMRNNYPHQIVGKLDQNFDLTEFYPWKFENVSDKDCIDLVLKNIDFTVKNEDFINYAFAVDANTLEIEDYYIRREFSKTDCYNYKTNIKKTIYYPSLVFVNKKLNSFANTKVRKYNDILLKDKNINIKNFIDSFDPAFGWIYTIPDTDTIKKFTVGYKQPYDNYFELFKKLNFKKIIDYSIAIAEKSRQA